MYCKIYEINSISSKWLNVIVEKYIKHTHTKKNNNKTK